jgi:hypothetical protein
MAFVGLPPRTPSRASVSEYVSGLVPGAAFMRQINGAPIHLHFYFQISNLWRVGQTFKSGGVPFGVCSYKEPGFDSVFSLLDTHAQRAQRFFKLPTLGFQRMTYN